MGKSFIYLLFTKSNTLMSKAVSALTSDEYTHVSVCVDENLSDFYSFGRRRPCFMLPAGFTKESVYGGLYLRDESIPCKLVRIQTDEKKVDRAKAILDSFMPTVFSTSTVSSERFCAESELPVTGIITDSVLSLSASFCRNAIL